MPHLNTAILVLSYLILITFKLATINTSANCCEGVHSVNMFVLIVCSNYVILFITSWDMHVCSCISYCNKHSSYYMEECSNVLIIYVATAGNGSVLE